MEAMKKGDKVWVAGYSSSAGQIVAAEALIRTSGPSGVTVTPAHPGENLSMVGFRSRFDLAEVSLTKAEALRKSYDVLHRVIREKREELECFEQAYELTGKAIRENT